FTLQPETYHSFSTLSIAARRLTYRTPLALFQYSFTTAAIFSSHLRKDRMPTQSKFQSSAVFLLSALALQTSVVSAFAPSYLPEHSEALSAPCRLKVEFSH